MSKRNRNSVGASDERPFSEDESRSDTLLTTDRLVSGVAHDVSNLATAIRTSTDSLRALDRGQSDSNLDRTEIFDAHIARLDHLDRIDRAAAQSAAFMNAIASLDRPESHASPATLDQTLTHVAQLLRRALEIEIGTPSEMPSEPRPGTEVSCDLGKLLRALILLCGKAGVTKGRVRLRPTNRREIAIELSQGDGSETAVCPLESDIAQARDALASFKASLPLSYANGRGGWSGSIRLESSGAPDASRFRPRTSRGESAQTGSALVAEDHAQVREALIDALTRCGFSVEAVEDGDALVDRGLAGGARHDVMLIDYDLPGRNGASALEALRSAGVETPALMISGNIDFRPRVETMPNTDFLQKPFGIGDIRAWAVQHLRSGGSIEMHAKDSEG